MIRTSLSIVILCLAGLTLGTCTAEDWPEFRGPTGQGHSSETGLPIRWSPTENVTWKVELAGEGWSSPIVYQGRVYLTSAVPVEGDTDDRSLRTLCLDARTGEEIWNVEVFRQLGEKTERIHAKNSHASPTPIAKGKHVFVHFGPQGTACLTLAGDIVWKTELRYAPRHGNGGSPVLVDGMLVVSCDGTDKQFVAALDQETGTVVWKTNREAAESRNFSFTTPLVISVDGQSQIVSPGTDSVSAYAPQTGEAIWKFRYDGYSVIPRPVFAHGLVYICTGYNSPSLFAIRPDGRGDVTDSHEAWSSKRGIPHTPSLLMIEDDLYFISDKGIASCVDARSGELYWTERIGGNYSASPVFADGRIYFQSEQGETVVIEPGHEYRELARSSLEARTLASMAVADGALFLRTDKQLLRIESPQNP